MYIQPNFRFADNITKDGKTYRWVLCTHCFNRVKLNGPGSDSNMFTRAFLWCMNKTNKEEQELFTPAADIHDYQCHCGLDDNCLKRANDLFRENCYRAIDEKFHLTQKNLLLKIQLYRLDNPAKKWWKLWDRDELQCIHAEAQLNALIKWRKEKEIAAEIYYTALCVASRAVVETLDCTNPNRSKESLK